MNNQEFDKLLQIFTEIFSIEDIANYLEVWGKKVRISIDEKDIFFDFSRKNKNYYVVNLEDSSQVDIKIKSTYSVFLGLITKKLNPIDVFTQGQLEIEGNLMEAMEFAELFMQDR